MANDGVIPAETASEAVRAPETMIFVAPLVWYPMLKCVIVFDPAVHAPNVTTATLLTVVGAVPVTENAPDVRATATRA